MRRLTAPPPSDRNRRAAYVSPVQFPSLESLRAQGHPPELSLDMLRLRWKPFGPLGTSVHVAFNARDPPYPEDEPYFEWTDPPDGPHHIRDSSLTEPPVSSVTVTQDNLNSWEDVWVGEHLPHADCARDVWAAVPQPGHEGGGDGDDKQGRKLMRCCGEDRPHAPAPLVVPAFPRHGYVTIHAYITAVHGWLQKHRKNILKARGLREGQPVPTDTAFYINPHSLDRVTIEDRSRNSNFTLLWTGWAAYVDRRVKEELSGGRQAESARLLLDFLEQAREWAMQGESQAQLYMRDQITLMEAKRLGVPEMLRRKALLRPVPEEPQSPGRLGD